MTRILVADDEASIRLILSRALKTKGFEVTCASDGTEALALLKTQAFDVAIVDIRMPGVSGLELLNQRDTFVSDPAIFVLTAEDTMENAVEAMKRGAYDYLAKPFDLDEVSILVDRALETQKLKAEVISLKNESSVSPTLVGKSKALREVFKIIGRVANQNITVLIQGESGTGKELVARAIHFQGKRAQKSFIAVNCSAIPGNLLESELFGYRKGAFTGADADKVGTFEAAHGGTLFLDEIGDMPPALQAKLLRVLQEGEVQRIGDAKSKPVDVRVIAATNQSLSKKIKSGDFREDLFFRLNVVNITLPPLRERTEDMALLADHFLEKYVKEFHLPPKKISKEALDALKAHSWPGNIRELENLFKKALILSQGSVLGSADFPFADTGGTRSKTPLDLENLEREIETALQSLSLKTSLVQNKPLYDVFLPLLERPLIRFALQKTNGNQIKAAAMLGLNRNTLRKKIRELKVERRGLGKKR